MFHPKNCGAYLFFILFIHFDFHSFIHSAVLLLISKSGVCYIRLFCAASHVKTRQLWLLGEEKQKSEIVMITEKQQQSQAEHNVFSPF